MEKKIVKSFKNKWNEVDEKCPTCGNITKKSSGLTKQNISKLFKKPTMQDWIIFIMLVLILFGAWAYNEDVKNYRELIAHPDELCKVYYDSILHGNFGDEYNSSLNGLFNQDETNLNNGE